MFSLRDILTTVSCVAAAARVWSTVATSAVGLPPPSNLSVRRVPSALHNVFPEAPDLTRNSKTFQVEAWNNASQVEQILIFNDIPINARDCSVRWRQGNRIDRLFICKGVDAVARVKQLSQIPQLHPITFNSIQSFDHGNEDIGAADFGDWDDLESWDHIVGSIDCSENIFLKAALRDVRESTKIVLDQNDQNGFYITYSI
ncbi:hypothetical protein ACHAPI_011872 [Fusarium lateritium]